MNIELKHLRTILAIHEAGSLQKATEKLNLTQSALSHQLRHIKEQIGVEIFVPETRPLKLSPEGLELVEAARRILPEMEKLKSRFIDLRSGQTGRLFIAIECHACFEWLFPVLESFRKNWGDVDVDIRPGLAFDALPGLQKEDVDLVVSSDPDDLPGIEFVPLFDYAPVFVAAKSHPLAKKPFIEAKDFAEQTLITYPVERSRLDLFSQLLIPAKVEPKAIRQAELTAVILLLVASNRGVAVLPDWVVREVQYNSDYVTRPLTESGLTRRLYAAVRSPDLQKPFFADLIELAGKEARRLQST